MASGDLQAVKRRIRSVTSMEHITNAMKLVSAAKLRRAKTSFEKSNQYLHFITDSIAEIFNNAGEVPEKYTTPATSLFPVREDCAGVSTPT